MRKTTTAACIAAVSAILINISALAAPIASVAPTASTAPTASATPEASTTPEASIAPTANTLDFTVHLAEKKYVIASSIVVEVYDKNGALVGTDSERIDKSVKSVSLHYDIPEYSLGDSFKVKLVEGADTLKYDDTVIGAGESFEIKTDFYTIGNTVVPHNSYTLDGVPLWEKEVFVYVNGKKLALPTHGRIIDGYAFAPVRTVAEALGISVSYNKKYDSVVCSVGSKQMVYNMNSKYADIFGKGQYLPAATQRIKGHAVIPVQTLAEAFEAPIETKDRGDYLEIKLGESKVVANEAPVNKWNISSRTKYLVWVSKSEYKVRVYEGSTNKWRLLRTAPCAIGAPGTPTITGSFEYIERTRWDYGTYYVGPVLRFHNGYALHSTLLYYGGGEYDGRTGVQISHGCVRLHPADINWIADTIPLYTRIYITE